MSSDTVGRGAASDEFDDDEIEWEDNDTAALSPIEEMAGESMDVVVPDGERFDDDTDEDADDH